MNQALEPGRPIINRIANICAFAALIPLIYLAEWIPGLLPRSPSLAYSQDPEVSSVVFPVVAGILALLGFTSWLLLRRLHWSGLVTFAVFWLALLTFLLRSGLQQEAPDYKVILGLAVLVAFPIVLAHGLITNWESALRSNKSLERARGR